MSKKVSKFHFKQFAVEHHRSSMKVGVDGVLIGCWTDTTGAKRILDVGTGCGLIALIMAQRVSDAHIVAIDIDAASIDEARDNIEVSPWPDRITAEKCSYSDVESLLINENERFDLIVSNPPFFDSGIKETVTAREKARHQGDLSPLSLLEGAAGILNHNGSVSMVVPTDISDSLADQADSIGFRLIRKCLVRGHAEANYKRVLLQWVLDPKNLNVGTTIMEQLTLEESPGQPTEEYRALCGDFYLRF